MIIAVYVFFYEWTCVVDEGKSVQGRATVDQRSVCVCDGPIDSRYRRWGFECGVSRAPSPIAGSRLKDRERKKKVMRLKSMRFLSLLFTTLALGPALAHLLELPNKIHLSKADYL